MQVLITGASSGMGREMAVYLGKMGWDLILVARRSDKLETLKEELPKNISVSLITMDISVAENAKSLYEQVKDRSIDMLINNAGFGIYGEFISIDLDREIQLINTNITAVHILTKLFLQDFVKRNRGYILNVASIAGFFSGPLMATYYATKNYVVSLTGAVYEELKRKNSRVRISALCPGPVDTEFSDVAHVSFATAPLDSKTVAEQAVDGVMNGKLYIVPSAKIKGLKLAKRFLPDKLITHFCYNFQKRKK